MVLSGFSLKCGNFSFEFCIFSFLFGLITNKARKLEVEESNLIMEIIGDIVTFSISVTSTA